MDIKGKYQTGDEAMRGITMNSDRAIRWVFCFVLVAASTHLFADMAWAADSTATTGSSSAAVFSSVQNKTNEIFTNVRNILMVVGALGVLGLAASAFFGHFKWSWAVSLLGGLALIAFVSQIITYFGLTAPGAGG